MKQAKKIYTHPDEAIILNIRFVRGQKVLIDSDLAKLYSVETKVLNQAVKRNIDRFPSDFMFQLTEHELETLSGLQPIENISLEADFLRSQFVTSKIGRGGARTLPYAFTEQGVAMLSSVLNSPTAIHINIQIIRIFVKMREMLASHIELQKRIEEIEQSLGTTNQAVQELYDLFIRLVEQDIKDQDRRIGFRTD